MAFVKYARATVVTPRMTPVTWGNATVGKGIRVAKGNSESLIERASALVGQPFDPNEFLLTHATIVASVDVYSPQGIKTGARLEDGFRVNRRYSDFRVKPASDKFINNNLDGWSRGVLAKAYRTFIGGHNFVEHVQVEDLSKGRIIDAVARDIGESLYTDILIATSRKHRDLVTAIENGKMGTLSMGCTVDGTQCTKCGHWAADETEMCSHIKYEKGNTFFDDEGVKHRVAELCGHESIDPTGGVTFIEASWVETPAFTGAVLRNVIEATEAVNAKAARVLAQLPPKWSENAHLKAAKVQSIRAAMPVALFAEGDTVGDLPAEPPPAAAPPADPMKGLEDELTENMRQRVLDRLKKEMAPPALTPEQSSSTSENLNKQASVKVYAAGLQAIVRTAASDPQLIDSVAAYNQSLGVEIPVEVYRAALKVGRYNQYRDVGSFKTACQSALRREPSKHEVRALLRLSMLISRRLASGK